MRKSKVEAERIAAEKVEAERKARLEAERVADENRKATARLATEKTKTGVIFKTDTELVSTCTPHSFKRVR